MAATNLTEIVKETKIVYIPVQLPVPIKRNSIGKTKTTFENVRKSGNYFVNSFENHYYVKLLNRELVKVTTLISMPYKLGLKIYVTQRRSSNSRGPK